MADVPLATPSGLGQLYRGRGDDILPARPVMTGDVFANVDIDAEDHDGLVMVLAHPCSMRAGARLVPRIGVAPIRPHPEIPFERWPKGYYRVFPLAGLNGEDDVARAVFLPELTTCRAERLDRDKRLLALTDHGIHMLQQRVIFNMARVVVGLDRLTEVMAPVLMEADLEEEWVEELAEPEGQLTLAAAGASFAEFMDAEGRRKALGEPTTRTDIARQVRAEIKTQRQAS